MMVRFVIGRAGSGKTQHCVDALVRAAENKPIGPPLFWLVPEQAAFMSERRLMAHPNLTGTFRIRVTGFRRLCRILAQQFAIPAEMELKPAERILLLSEAVRSCAKNLRAYGESAQHPGFLTTLDRTLRELVQNNQTSESLAKLSRQAETSSSNPMLANKLADLSLLLQSWQQITGINHPDPELFPQLVAQKLLTQPPLAGTAIWVDAFSSMSLLEMQLCAALAKSADRMEITLLADPESPAIRDTNAPPDQLSIFYRTERLYKGLTSVLKQYNVGIEKPLRLEQNHRTSSAPALTYVEQHLFSQTDNLAPVKDGITIDQLHAIELWHCRDPEEEIHAAGRWIRDKIAGGGRYRDIGVIVGDLDAYEEPVRRIFSALNISFFLDSRRGVNHHPLVLFLRTALTLPENNFSRSNWLVLIKTGLAGVDAGAASLLENYLLAHGIDNDDFSTEWKWSRTFADPDADEPTEDQAALLAAANTLREKLRQDFAPWLELAEKKEPCDGAKLAQALVELLDRLGVAKTLEQWILAARNPQTNQDGGAELAQMHQQLWTQTSELLSAMRRLFTGQKITPQQFSGLLTLGLGTLTLGLIPPTLDQVLISSADRSRHPELKTVIILGALEGLMPRLRRDESMLDDDDRRQLMKSTGSVDSSFDLPSDQDFLQSTFFDYVAFTRAAKEMIVCVPLADSAGRKTVPSIHIARLRELFGDLKPQNLMESQSAIAAAASIENLTREVALQVGSGASPDDSENKSLLLSAYDWLKKQSEPQILAALRRAWNGFIDRTPAQLSAELVRAITKKQKSVSELETVAACPLKWFFRYGLGLAERSELTMEPKDLGDLYHRTLRAFFVQVLTHRLNWPDCTDDQLNQTLDAAIEACGKIVREEMARQAPETSVVLQNMRRNLRELVQFHRDFARRNQLRPIALELGFGAISQSHSQNDPDAPVLPAYSVELDDRISVELRGKIDRVDANGDGAAMVIDYKLNEKTFAAADLEAGLSLQLITYLLALKGQKPVGQKNPLQPIGAFYQVLSPPIQLDKERSFKMRGLFDNQLYTSIDPVNSGQKSTFVALARKIDGAFYKAGHDGINNPTFEAVLKFTRNKLAELAALSCSGQIAPDPYRQGSDTPCKFCDYQSACPFDRLRGRFRKIQTNNKTALAKITGGENGS